MAKMNSMPVEQQETLTLNPQLGRPPSSKRTLVRVAGLPVAREGSAGSPLAVHVSGLGQPGLHVSGSGTLFPDLLPHQCPAPAVPERCELQLVLDYPLL